MCFVRLPRTQVYVVGVVVELGGRFGLFTRYCHQSIQRDLVDAIVWGLFVSSSHSLYADQVQVQSFDCQWWLMMVVCFAPGTVKSRCKAQVLKLFAGVS